nr:unnamed protein product [Callosobruchus analis]
MFFPGLIVVILSMVPVLTEKMLGEYK